MTAHEALEALGEVIWAGQPRDEDATCVVCAGYWPHHVDECFAGEAMNVLRGEIDRMRPTTEDPTEGESQ